MALAIQGNLQQDYSKLKLQDLKDKNPDVAAVVAQNREIMNNPFISGIGNDIASKDVKNNSPVDTAAIIAENKKKHKQEQAGADVSAVLAMSSQPPITDPSLGNRLCLDAA
ncbi:hypothetical protein IKA15_05945 [bacterium]|nr:hypothetical protein [bacterium]